jgi:hypothetical protein
MGEPGKVFMHGKDMIEKRHWYREPWVWLLIALPASAVIGGMVTIYLAIVSSDGLVEDDYYKRGKTINLELARDQVAAHQELQAIVGINSQTGQVTVRLESRDQLFPERVSFLLLHPTRAGKDQRIELEPDVKGVYIGTARPVEAASWHVQLETGDWRLSGRMQLPGQATLRLVPQNTPVSKSPILQ